VLLTLGRQELRVVLVVLLPTPRLLQILSLGHLWPRGNIVILLHLSLGPLGPRGDVLQIKSYSPGPQGPRVDLVVLLPASRISSTSRPM